MKNLIATVVFGTTFATSAIAQTTQPDDICVPAGYLVGYFNGVMNDLTDSFISANEIRKVYGNTNPADSQRIRYDVFFNPSQGFFQDFAEAFKQKVALHPDIAGKFEYFWTLLSDIDSAQQQRLPGFNSLPSDDLNVDRAKIAAQMVAQANPEAVANSMTDELRPYIIEGTKVIMVAHSQGNLFARSVYNKIKPELKATSVQVVHVAPPDDSLVGDYTLNNQDRVINLIRQIGHVKDANVFLAENVSFSDPLLHGFVETYWNKSLPTFQHIKIAIDAAFAAVKEEPDAANKGFFTLTLNWDVPGDLDLHVVEPDGTHVYYGAKQGVSGRLDRDDTRGTGPEHYTSTCSASQLQTGVYRVSTVNFDGKPGRTGTIAFNTRSFSFIPRRVAPGPAFVVTVTKDEQGRYLAVVN